MIDNIIDNLFDSQSSREQEIQDLLEFSREALKKRGIKSVEWTYENGDTIKVIDMPSKDIEILLDKIVKSISFYVEDGYSDPWQVSYLPIFECVLSFRSNRNIKK